MTAPTTHRDTCDQRRRTLLVSNIDLAATAARRTRIWAEQDRLRIFPLIEGWHRLGPRSAFELLDELVGPDPFLADDTESLLRKYAQLNPAIVDALDGRKLQLPLTIVAGGKR